MAKIKIIELLKSLSSDELKLLDNFVKSPIHNKHKQVMELFQLLRKQIASGNTEWKPEKIFEKLFPNSPLDLQKLHHISSYLLNVIEEFLAWKTWRSNEIEYHKSLLKAYHNLRLENFFTKRFEKLNTIIQNDPTKDSLRLRNIYEMELELFNHKRTLSRNKEFRLQELSNSLDQSFIAEKLKTACILLSNQSVTKSDYETGLLNVVMDFLDQHPYLNTPSVSIYYFAAKTLSNQEDDHSFQQLKILLNKYSDTFLHAELNDLYIFSINYCIRRINMGQHHFMQEVFELYKIGMATEIFIQEGQIAPRTYSNIIMSGLRSSAFDWVEWFIHKYKEALPEKQREGFFNYNLARLYFEKNNYSKAMPLLLMMEYEDVLLTSLGKILLAQMYFEQGETEALSSLLNSFNIYLKRKKMLGYHKESYLNFNAFLSKLINPKNKEIIENMITQIESTQKVAEKEWLINQCSKLKN